MPKRKRKVYSRPRKPFDKPRIEEENVLKEQYGLKNKKEIWKADTAIGRIRNLAKNLITKSEEEKKAFINKLKKQGFRVESIADSLALNKEDWLKRRLQTIVAAKKLTNTPKQARQFIVHKHVIIRDRVVNIPSYQVPLEEESLIRLNIVLKPKEIKKSKMEEIQEEIKDASSEILDEDTGGEIE
jgi:small subunit ribosomal protein S4